MSIGTNETIASIEIVADYIHRYLDYNKTFLSFTLSSANDENDDNQFRQMHLANILLTHIKLVNFTYSIFAEIDNSQKRYMQPFHVVFVDGSESLT